MAVIWATGPHFGRVPSATGNTNRRFIDGASSASVVSLGGGEYAISCSGTSTVSNISLSSNTIGATQQFVMSGKLRFPTSLPSTSPDLAVSGTGGANDLYLFFQQSSSKLAMAWGAGTPVVSSSTVTFDTDYTIDVHVDRSANPNVVHWWINGVSQTNCSDAQASGNVSSYTWGRDSAATGTYYWRDLRVSVTGADAPLGVGKVHTLAPSGTATEVGTANATARFTTNGGGLDATFNSSDIMAALSEIPPVVSAAATGIYQRTSSTTSFARIPMGTVTIGSATVELATIRVLAWAGSTLAYTLALRVWDGTSSTVVIAKEDPNGSNSTSDPTWWCATYTPVGGWDQTKLDNLEIEIGGSDDISPPPGAHAIFLELSLKASTGESHSGTASFAATGSLSASGVKGGKATATLSAAGTLTASGSKGSARTAAFTAAASLAGSGAKRTAQTATFAATGSLTATGAKRSSGTATLTATGTLTTTGSKQAAAAAAFMAVGTFAATGSVARAGTAAFAAAGTLASTGVAGRFGTATMSAVATFTAAGGAYAEGAAIFAAVATFVATGEPGVPDDGMTHRPFAGVTTRPTSGTTTRPNTGTTYRP